MAGIWEVDGFVDAHKDNHDPQDGSDPLDIAAAEEIVGVQAAGIGVSHAFAAADHGHAINHGIADNHLVTVDGSITDNDYAKWTVNGLEGRSLSETKTDLEYMTDLVDDTTPQLGGDLDCQSNIIQGNVENNLNTQKLGGDILCLMTDPKLLNVMCEDPSTGGACYIDISGNSHDGTPNGTWTSGDRLKQGRSWVLDPNGVDTYIDFGDHDDFSFGDGSNDSAFTIITFVKVIRGAGYNHIISKRNDTTGTEQREWNYYITTAGIISVRFHDESLNVHSDIVTDTGLSEGWHLIIITYDGSGGATAMNGVNIYSDGNLVNSTPTHDGNYIAMENTTAKLLINTITSSSGIPTSFNNCDIGIVAIDAVEQSASDVWRMWQYVLAAYSENGTSL